MPYKDKEKQKAAWRKWYEKTRNTQTYKDRLLKKKGKETYEVKLQREGFRDKHNNWNKEWQKRTGYNRKISSELTDGYVAHKLKSNDGFKEITKELIQVKRLILKTKRL